MDISTTIVIVLLVIITLWWVLRPLWQASTADALRISDPQFFVSSQHVAELAHRRDALYAAIKELEQDLASDKISEADYGLMRTKLTHEAAQVLKLIDEQTRKTEESIEQELDGLLAQYRSEVSSKVDQSVRKKARQEIKAASTEAEGVHCPSCHNVVGPNDVFCSQCGTSLQSRCPQCQVSVLPNDRFCPQCGTTLLAEVAQ